MDEFKLVLPYKSQGDQPQTIAELKEGLKRSDKYKPYLGLPRW